jgi:hypothetical protein
VFVLSSPGQDPTLGRRRRQKRSVVGPTRRRHDFSVGQRRDFENVFFEIVVEAGDRDNLASSALKLFYRQPLTVRQNKQ